MSKHLEQLRSAYVAGLNAYLRNADEEALTSAYELGRRAVVDGLGVLDMAALHRGAVEQLGVSEDLARSEVATAIASYFNELLSPFEMAFRGYRVANEQLQSLNLSLLEQKEAVERANQDLESFTQSVSHDLRSPLGRIDGFSELILERHGSALSAEAKRYLDYIRMSTREMLQLVRDLLSLARVTRGELVRTTVDLSALAQRVCDDLQMFASTREAEITIQPGMVADADPALISVVLTNLLGNAWKFTSKRPHASIAFGRTEQDGRDVYFVRDNGAGFDMQHAAKLFGAFSRLHAASDFEGTGIGLATVKRVIHRHDGDIWAEGRVDAGATFYFTLGGDRRP